VNVEKDTRMYFLLQMTLSITGLGGLASSYKIHSLPVDYSKPETDQCKTSEVGNVHDPYNVGKASKSRHYIKVNNHVEKARCWCGQPHKYEPGDFLLTIECFRLKTPGRSDMMIIIFI